MCCWSNRKPKMNFCFWFLRDVEDDVISLGFKGLCVTQSACVLLWLLSFVLIMDQVIQQRMIASLNVFLFVPMWLGSLLATSFAFYISCNVCGNATLVTRERRLYMRSCGTERDFEFMDYDSLPLLRKLFCLGISCAVTGVVALIGQMVFYLWFVEVIHSLWDAVMPFMALLLCYQTYMYLVHMYSFKTCAMITLLTVQLVLVTYKFSGEVDWRWTTVTIPSEIVLLTLAYSLASLWISYLNGRYQLTILQCLCLVSCTLSVTTGLVSASLVFSEEYSGDPTGCFLNCSLPAILWTCTVVLYVCSALVVVNVEGWRTAVDRGFVEPLPLSLTGEGWAVAPHRGYVHSFLLGRVTLSARLSYRELWDSAVASSTETSVGPYQKAATDASELIQDRPLLEPLEVEGNSGYQSSSV